MPRPTPFLFGGASIDLFHRRVGLENKNIGSNLAKMGPAVVDKRREFILGGKNVLSDSGES